MKIVIESPKKLTDSDLEEIVDVWNRKGRRIAVYTLIQTLISLHMHTLTAHALCHYQHQMNFNNTISMEEGNKKVPREAAVPLAP